MKKHVEKALLFILFDFDQQNPGIKKFFPYLSIEEVEVEERLHAFFVVKCVTILRP